MALRAELEALAPAPRSGGGGRGGRGGGGGAAGPPNLQTVSQAMMSAAMSMQGADVAPTMRQVAACEAARAQFQEVMRRWAALRASGRIIDTKPPTRSGHR